VWQRGQDIKIVSEIEENTLEFQEASKLLNAADRIVAIGFGFAEDNVRRLQYFREQESEDRDIKVVSGVGNSPIPKNEYSKWVSRWGLKENTHWWPFDSNLMFTHGIDLFD